MIESKNDMHYNVEIIVFMEELYEHFIYRTKATFE